MILGSIEGNHRRVENDYSLEGRFRLVVDIHDPRLLSVAGFVIGYVKNSVVGWIAVAESALCRDGKTRVKYLSRVFQMQV